MLRLLRTCLTAGLGLVLWATPAAAQGGLILGGGFTLPQGDYGNAVKKGYHGMAGIHFGVLGAPLGIRADVGYHLNDYDVPGNPDAASNLIAVSGDAVYTFNGVGIRPYLLGGITWGQLKCNGNDCASNSRDSDTGMNLGGGLDFGGFFAEARYIKIGGDLDVKVVPLTVGFRF